MRKLVVGTFLSLDGVMQAPGGPNEDRDGGFQHGGWLVPYFDEKFGNIMTEWTLRAGAFLRSPTCQLRKALAGRSTSSARTESSVPLREWNRTWRPRTSQVPSISVTPPPR